MKRLAAVVVTASLALGSVGVVTAEAVPHRRPPRACLDALTAAESVMSLAGQAFGYMADSSDAAARYDVVGIEAATANLNELNPTLRAARALFDALAAKCRRKR